MGVSGQNLIPVVFSFVFQTCDCAFGLALLFVSLPKMHSAAQFKDQESGFIKPDVKFSCQRIENSSWCVSCAGRQWQQAWQPTFQAASQLRCSDVVWSQTVRNNHMLNADNGNEIYLNLPTKRCQKIFSFIESSSVKNWIFAGTSFLKEPHLIYLIHVKELDSSQHQFLPYE